jgi:vacuolar-type H+-ATPase subunit F/Vma7
MSADAEQGQTTRMLFLGDDSLADGFRLIGFETFPNPEPGEVDRIFRDLIRAQSKAFAIVDDRVMAADIPALAQVRREGGRIVVVAIPPLKEPPRLASEVATRLQALFGTSTMTARESS